MPLRLKPLDQQTIVITGASSGIGLATARRAGAHGARVFLISRNGEALAKICENLTSLVPPLLKDPRRAAGVRDNLETAGDDGQTRSRFGPSRPFRLYTGAVLHPGLALGVLALIGIGAVAAAQGGAWRR
ncbi:hypothetical protein BH10PSE1_BH10PSE1_13310 [soil metagenome]